MEVVSVVLVRDVVAVEVALSVVNEGLEVEVGQLVHDVEHDVLHEFIVELRRAGEDLDVAAVLGKATVQHSVVLLVGVDDGSLDALVVLVADEALAIL